MKEIKLTQGKVALVDDEDFEELNKYKWCAHNEGGRTYATGYNKESFRNYKHPKMHRVIMKPLNGEDIDHVDGDGLNNQRNNLRTCTHQQNLMNSRKRKGCSSIFKGVTWHKKLHKWRAYIVLNSKQIALGCYSFEEDAARAYDKKALELFGDFALLNCAKRN